MAFKSISATLGGDGILKINSLPSVNQGENASVSVDLTLEEDFLSAQPSDAAYYFEFDCADGKKYVSPQISPQQNKITYDIENAVLSGSGEVWAQLVVKSDDADYIFKTQRVCFGVGKSVNATIPVYFREDFLTQIQAFFKEAKETQEKFLQSMQTLDDTLTQFEADLAAGKYDGPQGKTGPQGIQGIKGDKGDQGIQGEQGIQGVQGETGPQGPKGDKGEKGDTGPQGPKGDKGDTGERGAQGIRGDAGVLIWGDGVNPPITNIVWQEEI